MAIHACRSMRTVPEVTHKQHAWLHSVRDESAARGRNHALPRDDILIFSETEKKHEKHVKKILKKLQEKNLYLKSEKCKFHKQQVEYLKYIVTTEELKMNSEKIKVIIKFLTSDCIKNIQAFQKMTEYYKKLIDSMPRRVEAVIAANGYSINY